MSIQKKQPRPVPALPIPKVSEWGGIVLPRQLLRSPSHEEASDALNEAIAALSDADRENGGQAHCFIKHPSEPRYDATGFWRKKESERIIHRYAGLSKSTPPVDPFRRESVADLKIRCEIGLVPGKPNENPIRCEVLHAHNRGQTSVVVTTGPGMTPLAPWHQDPAQRASILLQFARSCLDALMKDGDRSADFIADSQCQVAHVLSLCGNVAFHRHDYVENRAQSPIGRRQIAVSWSRDRCNPFRDGRSGLMLPDFTTLMLTKSGDDITINVGQALHQVAVHAVDAMATLRAHARIREMGYQEIER